MYTLYSLLFSFYLSEALHRSFLFLYTAEVYVSRPFSSSTHGWWGGLLSSAKDMAFPYLQYCSWYHEEMLDKILKHQRKIIVIATLSIGQLCKETEESHINDAEVKGIVSSHQRIQRILRSNDNPEPRSSHQTSYSFFYERIRQILSAEVQ
jgi:hypothetical protein